MPPVRSRGKPAKTSIERHIGESKVHSVGEEVRPPVNETRLGALERARILPTEIGMTSMSEVGALATKKFYVKMGYEFVRAKKDEETGIFVTVYLKR